MFYKKNKNIPKLDDLGAKIISKRQAWLERVVETYKELIENNQRNIELNQVLIAWAENQLAQIKAAEEAQKQK